MDALNLDVSLLNDDIQRIMKSSSPMTRIDYSAILHINNKQIDAMVIDVYYDMDFATNKTDIIILTAKVYLGDYLNIILPNSNSMEITLVRDIKSSSSENDVRRYKANILSERDGGNTVSNIGSDSLNREMVDIEFQLLDPFFYIFRNTLISGIYNSKLVNVVSSLLTDASNNTKTSTGTHKVMLNITPFNNNRVYTNLAIPSGTNALTLVPYLQDKFGLYNGHVGFYMQMNRDERNLSIFPLAGDKHLYEHELTFIDPGSNIYDSVEDRYIAVENSYTILGSNFTSFNVGEAKSVSYGNGLVNTIEESLYNRSVSLKGSVGIDTKTTTQWHQDRKLDDGSVQYKHSNKNPNISRSSLVLSKGSYYEITWAHCDINLIRPNVKVTVLTVRFGKIVKLVGTIHKAIITHYQNKSATVAKIRMHLIEEG
jgi:hypothetical protein